jgi:hypothetical protein
MKEPFQIHDILTAEAAKQQLPKHYHRDLTVHDLAGLRLTHSQRFIWVLRTCGTHLIPLDGRSRRDARMMIEGCRQFCDEQMLWYVFENDNLRPIDADEAKRLAAE